jgi:DNA polymerase
MAFKRNISGKTAFPLLQESLNALRFFKEVGIDTLPLREAERSPRQSTAQKPRKNPASQLKTMEESLRDCTRCKLAQGRNNLVFGEGNPQAALMFIGEGPGRDEDRQGRPFVGRAGQLLTRIIEAMGLTRQDVYIANIVKCRPPNNRNPEPDEISACLPFLMKQIEIIQPRVICALGGVAFQTLMETKAPISKFRGTLYPWRGDIHIIPTFHPAYLLRNPAKKREVWEDIQKIMAFMGIQKKT